MVLMIAHILTNIWLCIGLYHQHHYHTGWIVHFKENKPEENYETFLRVYVLAFYFIIQNMTSLGFGDIRPNVTFEFLFCMFNQVLTIISFSYLLGSSYLNIDKEYHLRDQADLL